MSFKGCISCRKCEFIRGSAFCGTNKLTEKQLYNDKGHCSEFEDKTEQTAKAEIKSQDNKSQKLLDELSKMPPMVVATAYLHAMNYTMYGVDVTEKWLTATQNASALEKAYKKGYYDALQRQAESEVQDAYSN